jgi:4-hydroxy-tetrahydrodipicolinate synthase
VAYPRAVEAAIGLRGIWPALLTPLTPDLKVDLASLARHARGLVDAGCAGVTPFGTTGEGPSFSVAERKAAVEALAREIPAQQILVSTSCASLEDVVDLTRHAVALGAWGCLMMPPFFHKNVSDQGVVEAYAYVIDRVADARLRLVLYHIPQLSGVPLTQGVIAKLLDRYPQTIVALKDSGCDLATSLGFADAFTGRIGVHVGNEADLPALARRGSAGAVSGIANFLPRLVRRLVEQPDAAQAELAAVKRVIELATSYPLTAAMKGIMAIVSGDERWRAVRPPLVPLQKNELETLRRGWLSIDPGRNVQ